MDYIPRAALDKVQSKVHVDSLGASHSSEVPASISVPSLTINDLSFSLTASAPHIAISQGSLLPLPAKTPKRKLRRPSTASSAEEKGPRLPSSLSSKDILSSHMSVQEVETMARDANTTPPDEMSIQEMNRRAHAAVAGLRAEASRLAGAGA